MGWFANVWRLMKGACALAGQVGMDDRDFLGLEWRSTFQREVSDPDNGMDDADCERQDCIDSDHH